MGRFLLLFALLAAGSPVAAARHPVEMALTFDDLPAHGPLPPGETRLSVSRRIARSLGAAKVEAPYGFVNAESLAQDADDRAALAAWRLARLPVGNHTWSHPDLNDVSAAAFEADIQRDEPLLRLAAGRSDWHWFRYPYLSEGEDPAKRADVRRFLAAHGYRIADANVDFGDYLWNEPYARCAARHDLRAIAGLERSYLAAAEESLAYSRMLARKIYGRDISYVALLHVGAFDARIMPRLLALYRQQGVRFVSLQRAERDPAYRSEINPLLPPEASDLQDRAIAHGIAAPDPKSDEDMLASVCR